MKTEKGFTLLELLVVISIIGLLATIAFTALNTARTKARDTKRRAEITQISKAALLYFDTNQTMKQPNFICAGMGVFLIGSAQCPTEWENFFPTELPHMPLDSKNGQVLPDADQSSGTLNRRQYLYQWLSSTSAIIFTQLEINSGAPTCDGEFNAPTDGDNTNCELETGCVVTSNLIINVFGSDPWYCKRVY